MNAGVRLSATLRRMLSQWQLYVLVLPAVIYIFLFSYAPMYGVQIAFKDFRVGKAYGPATGWGSSIL